MSKTHPCYRGENAKKAYEPKSRKFIGETKVVKAASKTAAVSTEDKEAISVKLISVKPIKAPKIVGKGK